MFGSLFLFGDLFGSVFSTGEVLGNSIFTRDVFESQSKVMLIIINWFAIW